MKATEDESLEVGAKVNASAQVSANSTRVFCSNMVGNAGKELFWFIQILSCALSRSDGCVSFVGCLLMKGW